MPDNYSGDISPTLLPQYQALLNRGIPPNVAYSILTQPSVGEGETPRGAGRWGSYSGWQDETRAGMTGPPRDQALSQQMWNSLATRQQNLPTWESHTPGDDDNLGFTRLPSGQYVPSWQHSSFQGGTMPPWSQMTPQQQAILLQMMQAQYGPQVAGAVPGMQPGVAQPTMAQQMMRPGQAQFGPNPMQQQMQNPLLNQQNNMMQGMNPQMLQYLMAMRGAQAPGLGQFSAPQYMQYPGF